MQRRLRKESNRWIHLYRLAYDKEEWGGGAGERKEGHQKHWDATSFHLPHNGELSFTAFHPCLLTYKVLALTYSGHFLWMPLSIPWQEQRAERHSWSILKQSLLGRLGRGEGWSHLQPSAFLPMKAEESRQPKHTCSGIRVCFVSLSHQQSCPYGVFVGVWTDWFSSHVPRFSEATGDPHTVRRRNKQHRARLV